MANLLLRPAGAKRQALNIGGTSFATYSCEATTARYHCHLIYLHVARKYMRVWTDSNSTLYFPSIGDGEAYYAHDSLPRALSFT